MRVKQIIPPPPFYTMDNALRRTALVTGASGGIGKAIAERFASNGTDVIISARNLTDLEKIAAEWRSRYSVNVTAVVADLAKADAAQAFFAEVARSGNRLPS